MNLIIKCLSLILLSSSLGFAQAIDSTNCWQQRGLPPRLSIEQTPKKDRVLTIAEEMPYLLTDSCAGTYSKAQRAAGNRLLLKLMAKEMNKNLPPNRVEESFSAVYLQFVVDQAGELSQIQAIYPPGRRKVPLLEKAAIQALKQLDKEYLWQPAKHKGNVVACRLILPVRI